MRPFILAALLAAPFALAAGAAKALPGVGQAQQLREGAAELRQRADYRGQRFAGPIIGFELLFPLFEPRPYYHRRDDWHGHYKHYHHSWGPPPWAKAWGHRSYSYGYRHHKGYGHGSHDRRHWHD